MAPICIVFDVLFRLLQHIYGKEYVTYVRNITDIDDKIIMRARETGRSIKSITKETISWYNEDMRSLGALPPSHQPRATKYVPEMIKMIGKKYYPSRGKSIDQLILMINSNSFKKVTLGGCLIEKANQSVLISREN